MKLDKDMRLDKNDNNYKQCKKERIKYGLCTEDSTYFNNYIDTIIYNGLVMLKKNIDSQAQGKSEGIIYRPPELGLPEWQDTVNKLVKKASQLTIDSKLDRYETTLRCITDANDVEASYDEYKAENNAIRTELFNELLVYWDFLQIDIN